MFKPSKCFAVQKFHLMVSILLFCFVVSGCAAYGASPASVIVVTLSMIRPPDNVGNEHRILARENKLNYSCVMEVFGHQVPLKSTFSLGHTFKGKRERLAKRAFQECDLRDFARKNNLDYECTEKTIFSRRFGSLLLTTNKSDASKREKEALQECKLSAMQNNEDVIKE